MLSLHERKLKAKRILGLLEIATKDMLPPMTTLIVQLYGRDPFLVLISCLLSLRSRDNVTFGVCKVLFARAKTPHELLAIPIDQLKLILSSINYYKTKAQNLHKVSQELIERFHSQVPNCESDLLSLSGVGRKTANLVLAEGFGIPAICVDTHVHRICNRLGLITTNTPKETEGELKIIYDERDWISLNRLFVMWGQNICVPLSPLCSRCVLFDLCPKLGVTKHR